MAKKTSAKVPSGPAFISYAYQDEQALKQLMNMLRPQSVTPFPFPPISVSPSEMVSNELISSIMNCRSLIYIDTPNSRDSQWVTLEQDYARRNDKLIFSYKPDTAQLELDERAPLDLPVFPSYTKEDNERVEWIIKFMREERFFDIFLESQDLSGEKNVAQELESAIYDRLKRGGFTVLFWSEKAAQSLWVKAEIEGSLRDFPKQVLVALLENVRPPPAPIEQPPIELFGDGPHGLDYRRVDDLIVSLYWLVQERGAKEKADYVVPFKGTKLLSKREANRVGFTIILGFIGAIVSVLTVGADNILLATITCALFAGIGYFWLADKILKK